MAAFSSLALLLQWRALGPPKRRRGRPRTKPVDSLLTGPPRKPRHRPRKYTPEILQDFLLEIESLRAAYRLADWGRPLYDKRAIRLHMSMYLVEKREKHWRAQGMPSSLAREMALKDLRVDERRVRSLAVLLSQARRARRQKRLPGVCRAKLKERLKKAHDILLTAQELGLLP